MHANAINIGADTFAVDADYRLSFNHRLDMLPASLRLQQQCLRVRARQELTIISVLAVGKYFL